MIDSQKLKLLAENARKRENRSEKEWNACKIRAASWAYDFTITLHSMGEDFKNLGSILSFYLKENPNELDELCTMACKEGSSPTVRLLRNFPAGVFCGLALKVGPFVASLGEGRFILGGRCFKKEPSSDREEVAYTTLYNSDDYIHDFRGKTRDFICDFITNDYFIIKRRIPKTVDEYMRNVDLVFKTELPILVKKICDLVEID